jgi:hypothetical protein
MSFSGLNSSESVAADRLHDDRSVGFGRYRMFPALRLLLRSGDKIDLGARAFDVLPLVNHTTVVDLIASTTTKTGLTVQCELDKKSYAEGIKVTDAEMAIINIESDPWHPEWNYTIKPRPSDRSGNS